MADYFTAALRDAAGRIAITTVVIPQRASKAAEDFTDREQSREAPRRTLIYGPPGVGKTFVVLKEAEAAQ